MSDAAPSSTVPRLARRPVGLALLVLAVVLSLTSPWYGLHRDELNFRMLLPAWGYVDRPPHTPAAWRAIWPELTHLS